MTLKQIAIQNLLRRKGKAMLILLGLVLGIGTVITVISFSDAVTGDINHKLEKYGANILIVPRTENLALNYGGRQELCDSVRRIAAEVAAGRLAPEASDGTVAAWGQNAVGQLGSGTTGDAHQPQPVTGLASVLLSVDKVPAVNVGDPTAAGENHGDIVIAQ